TCLSAAQAFLARNTGRYPLSPDMLAELQEIEQQGDAFKSFLGEKVVLTFSAADYIESAALYEAYRDYCRESGSNPLSLLKMLRALHDRYPRLTLGKKHRLQDQRQAKCVEGLRWRKPTDDPDENGTDGTDGTASIKPPYARARVIEGFNGPVPSVPSVPDAD